MEHVTEGIEASLSEGYIQASPGRRSDAEPLIRADDRLAHVRHRLRAREFGLHELQDSTSGDPALRQRREDDLLCGKGDDRLHPARQVEQGIGESRFARRLGGELDQILVQGFTGEVAADQVTGNSSPCRLRVEPEFLGQVVPSAFYR